MASPMMKPGWVHAMIAWLAATESYDSGVRIQKYMAGDPSARDRVGPVDGARLGTGEHRDRRTRAGGRSGPGTSGIDGQWRIRSGSTVLSSTRPRDSKRSPWYAVMVSLPHARPECIDSSCSSISPAL